jgi:hypothetical protein
MQTSQNLGATKFWKEKNSTLPKAVDECFVSVDGIFMFMNAHMQNITNKKIK